MVAVIAHGIKTKEKAAVRTGSKTTGIEESHHNLDVCVCFLLLIFK